MPNKTVPEKDQMEGGGRIRRGRLELTRCSEMCSDVLKGC